MEHKIDGKCYLVEVPAWNLAGFAVAQYRLIGGVPFWHDISADMDCTSHVKSYKSLDKVDKMRPYAVLSFTNRTKQEDK